MYNWEDPPHLIQLVEFAKPFIKTGKRTWHITHPQPGSNVKHQAFGPWTLKEEVISRVSCSITEGTLIRIQIQIHHTHALGCKQSIFGSKPVNEAVFGGTHRSPNPFISWEFWTRTLQTFVARPNCKYTISGEFPFAIVIKEAPDAHFDFIQPFSIPSRVRFRGMFPKVLPLEVYAIHPSYLEDILLRSQVPDLFTTNSFIPCNTIQDIQSPLCLWPTDDIPSYQWDFTVHIGPSPQKSFAELINLLCNSFR